MNRKWTTTLASLAAWTLISSPTLHAQTATQSPPAKKAEKAPEKPRTPEDALTPSPHLPKRHDEFMKRKEQGPIDLLFIGDSITDRWPKFGPDTWAKFAPYHPADFGVGGDRTEHVLWRFAHNEIDNLHPKVTVLLIGTNNIGHFDSEKPEWAAAGVKKILDQIHEKMPETKILLLAVFPRDAANSPHRHAVDAINQIISTYADGKQITYLDINKVFLDDKGEIPKTIMPDLLHPNAQGYDLWYNAMWPTLEQLLKS